MIDLEYYEEMQDAEEERNVHFKREKLFSAQYEKENDKVDRSNARGKGWQTVDENEGF